MTLAALIAVLALMNIVLGAWLTVYWRAEIRGMSNARREQPEMAGESTEREGPGSPEPAEPVSKSDGSPAAALEGPTPVSSSRSRDDIVAAWNSQIGEPPAQSASEAGLRITARANARFGEALSALELVVRQTDSTQEPGGIALVREQILEAGSSWLRQQHEVLDTLEMLGQDHAGMALMVSSFRELVGLSGSCLETAREQLDSPTPDEEHTFREQLVCEIHRLLETCHVLRDKLQHWLLACYRDEDRLRQAPGALQWDAEISLPNRLGIETIYGEWRSEDPQGNRMLCAAIIAIDAAGMLNRRIGAARVDELLRRVATLIQELLRGTRGFDRAARVGGNRLLVLLGDTGPNNAGAFVERLREKVAASGFGVEELPAPLTVTGAVTEVLAREPLCRVIQRLERALRLGRKQGGNRTVIEEGEGPRIVSPDNALDVVANATPVAP